MKIAIVSPLPPSLSGIADYTIDVVRALGPRHDVDLYFDQPDVAPSEFRTRPIGDLPSGVHDAVVYQMGNAPPHDFMYDWLERVPGFVVLHDLVLHHAFARRFLESAAARAYAADPADRTKRERALQDFATYEAAIESVAPGRGQTLRSAYLNSSGDLLPYAIPLFEPALRAARGVGVHNHFMLERVMDACPGVPVTRLAMPVTRHAVDAMMVAALRERLLIHPNERVVGTFGLVTREKGVEATARALRRVIDLEGRRIRWLIAGAVPDPGWLRGVLERHGVAPFSVVTGRLDASEFAAAMELSEVVVHLRYPSARETSAALLRVLAQGRPAIISDAAHQSEIPEDAVVRIDQADEEGALARAIDGALRDPAHSSAVGARGSAFAALEHAPERTLASYEQLLKAGPAHYSLAPK